ncbi:NAD-dependent epimerase/dehydratase family protein [Demequina sp. TTPB684]|uniref:NAD-dependent epimerase/dehydratase family protein n=1 Tax=unclassified Demequina TaxID=2620311 RepID=UPI001CF585F1|nr:MULTISPECIES: NAD-dependent epimerase/dehydratase family protein [unclassified Demequina]MCB2413045.1 NAD-dependent epimerase/dehydratase family protein [Demequina sp. TTPB684]UPU89462.1 NAD-dependent epimerase/dehydratase family protein [Demequina sp. TMPB413]
MRVLFLGGTGLISSAVSPLVVERGHQLTLVTRGTSAKAGVPAGASTIVVDIHDTEEFRAAIKRDVAKNGRYDVVVQWIGFSPDHVSDDIDTFDGITDQYVFISSASAYATPPEHYIVREDSTPLYNPYWQYSRDKAEAERRLRVAYGERGFPFTVVRPSHTYGYADVPMAINSWVHPWTMVDRLLNGKTIITPGDGSSLWTLTDHRDFAYAFTGLLGHQGAIGEEFHITSDDVLSWNQVHAIVAGAVGVGPEQLHDQTLFIPSELLARFDREAFEGPLLGDKAHAGIFDNSKVRSLVPDYAPQHHFEQSIHESIAWFMDDPARRTIDSDADALWDTVSERYLRGVDAMFD